MEKRVRVVRLGPVGHTGEEVALEDLSPSALLLPGVVVLVDGEVCRSPEEVESACRRSPEPLVLVIPALQGG